MKRLSAFIVVGMVFVFLKTSAQFSPFAVWQARDVGPDETPDSIDWKDFNNYSENLTITGIDDTITIEISVTNLNGTPTVSFAKNHGTPVVVAEGVPQTTTIENDDRLQFFMSGSELWSATITVKNVSDSGVTLDTVTGELLSSHYFVLSTSLTTGDLGGLSGANAWCLNELETQDWGGKGQVTLNTSTVRAFLCDGSSCQNVEPSTTYTYAVAGNATQGGDTFTSTALSEGPNDRNLWRTSTIFGTSYSNIWTGRGNGTAPLWAVTSDPQNCNGWTSSSYAVDGEQGITNANNADRWNDGYVGCSMSRKLICMVDDKHAFSDVTPDAVDWADFNIFSENQTFTGIDETILVAVLVTSISESATLYYSVNDGSWVAFDEPDYTSLGISSNDSLKFRIEGERGDSASFSIINNSDDNAVLDTGTGMVAEAKFFVLSNGTTNGELGGFVGADQWCLEDLANNDWMGKSSADINAATVKAFLCDSSGCQNLDPNSKYLFARSGSSGSGGSVLSTDGAAIGPGDNKDWSDADAFDISTSYHTGRIATTGLEWANTAAGNHCSDWTNATSLNSKYGISYATGAGRWRENDAGCGSTRRLICLVSDTHQVGDITPDPISWSDFDHISSTQTLSGVDGRIAIEVTASSLTGTPDLYFSKNSSEWMAFSGLTAQIGLDSSDTLAFKIDGTRNDQATLTIVNKSDGDTTLGSVVGTVQGKHFFVLSSATSNGNFGGLLGANSWCVGDLQGTNWKGKESVNVNGTTVRAFLCDSSGCNDVHPSSLYYFAHSGDASDGGGTFTSNALSEGPGDNVQWNDSTALGQYTYIWTGRNVGVSTLWATTTHPRHCSDWTSGSYGVDGRKGHTANTNRARWSDTNSACGIGSYIVCLVDD